MSYLSNKSRFYGWNASELKKGYVLPKPFEKMELKRYAFTDDDGSTKNVAIIYGLVNAAVALVQEELLAAKETVKCLNHSHMAAGTATTDKGAEAIFVEYADIPHSNTVQVARYDASETVEMIASLYNTVENSVVPMKLDGTAKEVKGCKAVLAEAAWAALLIHAREQDITRKIPQAYDMLKEALRMYYSDAIDESKIEEYFTNSIIALSWYMYKYLSLTGDLKLTLEESAMNFRQIKKDSLDSGTIAPSKGKKILPIEYKVFQEERVSKLSINPSDVDVDAIGAEIAFDRKYEDFTEEEKRLVPEVDPKENISPVTVGIIQEVKRTWGKSKELQCSRILLEGGAGTGKTFTVRSFCAHTKRPYVTHVCGTTDGPDAFLGYIVPYIEVGEKNISLIDEATAEDIMENPALCWPEDIEMDFAYDPDCAKERVSEMFNKFKGLFELAKTNPEKAKEQGVKYRYIPGSIARAVENGWVVEIQEPTCLLQQGALSCLFDVLDKGSVGVMSTPTGDMYRHNDFICFITQNRKYKGTKPLNEALRSRFTHIERMEDPKIEETIARVAKKTGVEDMDLISRAVTLYEALKEHAEDLNTDGTVTLRNLYDFVDAVNDGVDLIWAFERKLLNPVTTDKEDRVSLIEHVEDLPIFEDVALDAIM